MGFAFGNIMGSASSLAAGFGGNSTLKDFLKQLDKFGVQITSRFEATFSAIPQTTFYIRGISVPGVKQNIGQLYYDGKMVEIPRNYEYNHDFTMTIINDGSGIIYPALLNFVMGDTGTALMGSQGYTITIKAIGDNYHKGSLIKMNGVRIKDVSGLQFDNEGGGVQTFTVNCSAIDIEYTPEALLAVGGAAGAIGSLFG